MSPCILHRYYDQKPDCRKQLTLHRDAVILSNALLQGCVQGVRRSVQVIGPGWRSVDQQNGNALFIILLVSVDAARGSGGAGVGGGEHSRR